MKDPLKYNAEFYLLYCRVMDVILRVHGTANLNEENKSKRSTTVSLMTLSYRMEYLFMGVESQLKVEFLQLRVLANLLSLLSCVSQRDTQVYQFQLEKLKQRVFIAKNHQLERDLRIPDELEVLISGIEELEMSSEGSTPNIPLLFKLITVTPSQLPN